MCGLSLLMGLGLAALLPIDLEEYPLVLSLKRPQTVLLCLPLLLTCLVGGAPRTRALGWLLLTANVLAGGIMSFVRPDLPTSYYLVTCIYATTLLITLYSIITAQSASAATRLTLARMLFILTVTMNTPMIMRITGFYNPVFDLKIKALEDLAGLSGYSLSGYNNLLGLYLMRAIASCYMLIMVILMLFIAALQRHKFADYFFACYLFALLLGVSQYVLFPVVGPLALDLSFPGTAHNPAQWAEIYVHATNFPRNTLPSLHTTWSLFIFFFLGFVHRRLREVFYCLGFLALLGTLTTGNHYVFDLIISVPYFTFVMAAVALLTHKNPQKRSLFNLLCFSLALTAFWLVLLLPVSQPLWLTAPLLQFLLTLTLLLPLAGLWACQHAVFPQEETR